MNEIHLLKYFSMYNIITWNKDKLYTIFENNIELKDYCNNQLIEILDKCILPYEINNKCCNLNGKSVTTNSP